MADPKHPKDTTEVFKQAPADPQARPEKDEIDEAELKNVSGGAVAPRLPPAPPSGGFTAS